MGVRFVIVLNVGIDVVVFIWRSYFQRDSVLFVCLLDSLRK